MVNKTVIRLDMKGCHKCEKIALQSVTKIEGIHSLSIEMEDCTLTVIGEADPVFVAKKLRRKFKCVEIVSVEPMPLPQLALAAPETGKNGGSSQKEKSDKSKNGGRSTKSNGPPQRPPPPAQPEPEPKPEPKPESDKSKNGSKSTKSNGPKKPPPPAQPEPQPKPEPEPKPKPEPPCICICPTCTRYTPEIMWPQYHNPFAPDEVWYVWKEDQQESCTIM